MKVYNKTKKTALSQDYVFCRGLSKFIGLMLSKNEKKTLVFEFAEEQNIALHMFFVFYPIDVIFLDKNKAVVDKKENFLPFTFYTSKKMAVYAIELPIGTIKKSKTAINDNIKF